MRRGIIGSAALHVAVIGAAMVAWPHTLDVSNEPPPVVPVELVTIGEVSNVTPTVQQAATPESQPAESQPQTAPPPLPAAQPAEAAPPPPPPERKPPPEKPAKFNVDSILALLDKRTPKAPPAAPGARVADRTMRGIGAQDALTLSEVDALLAQMRECWNPPAGAPDPARLIVYVRVYLARDGSLAQAPQLLPESQEAAARDPFTRAAADAALRAIHVCEPYHMPPDKYDSWREIVMTFDPSKMLGR